MYFRNTVAHFLIYSSLQARRYCMFNILAVSVGLVTSFLLCIAIARGDKGQSPSFASFFIWGILNAIIALASYVQVGNYALAGLYTVTSFLTATVIFVKSGSSWNQSDTWVLLCAVGSMVIWYFTGPWWATVASTTAVMLAGIPQLQEINRNPDRQKWWPWASFAIANLCSICAGREWSVPERLYPTCVFLFSALLVREIIRKASHCWLRSMV